MTTDNEKIVLGEIETNNSEVLSAVQAAVKKVLPTVQTGTANKVSQFAKSELGASRRRKAVIERLDQIKGKDGDELRAGLINGTLQIADKTFYSVRPATDKDIDIIKSDAGTAVGLNSFDNAKIDKYALIHGIFLRYSDGTTEIDKKFDLPLPVGIANGELTLKVDSKEVLSEIAVERIASYGIVPSDKPFNYFELDNPKWIIPGKKVEAILKGADAVGAGFVKIMFDCSVIQPA
jgi:hypothetical protein